MKHILEFSSWAILESDDFKVYTLSNKPNYIYRRAGKDSNNNPKWQYQEKTTSDKTLWHDVENEESIKTLTSQYKTNLSKSQSSTGSLLTTMTSQYADNLAKSKASNDSLAKPKDSLPSTADPRDYWTLIAIIACESYTTHPQGMADVAQSIYNRFNLPDKLYGKSIADIIVSAGQYEPVTVGKANGAKWNSVNSKELAIQVYMKTKGFDRALAVTAIDAAIKAQKDSAYITNAKQHVGSRTEFLASKPSSSGAKGPVERSPSDRHNTFFWNYAGRTNYYDTKLLAATPKPDSVKVG